MTTGQPAAPDAEVLDPHTAPARLGEIVQQRPDLGAAVARHPQAYPALLDWLAAYGDPQARATVAALRTPEPASFTPAGPLTAGHAPAQAGYVAAHAAPVAVADPVAPAPEQADVDVLGATRPRPRGRVVAGIVAGVVVLALAAGGAFAYFTFLHGAGSPQSAVEKLVDGALSGDMVALGTSIAPSERELFQDLADGFDEIAQQRLGGVADAEESFDVEAILDTVDVDLRGMVYETEELAEGVAVVRITGGVIEADVDKGPFIDAVMEQYEAAATAGLEEMGYDPSMIDSELDTARDAIDSWVDETFPWTFDIAQVLEEQAEHVDPDAGDLSPLAFVTVDEGGWYVSPMLTVAELASYAAVGRVDHGGAVVDALAFATPEQAVTGTADAVEEFFSTHDLEALAAVMPLPERRLLSIYGEPLLDEVDWSGAPELTLDITDVDVATDGGRAVAEVLAFLVAVEPTDGGSPSTVRYDDGCMTVETSYQEELCLSDAPPLEMLGIDDLTLTVLKEGDGWLVSPFATLGDYLVRVTEGYADASEDGSLEELMYGF
ncbi:hypothetical protein [Demequina gelatinilytica]|uniref:variant leucine-rich repeat-containing protein n=1 Tax=Demequina gelatinilytica TaxID=1638980 RepID=UPI0007858844|nr:hypothetical protein [Demequina gelatinilytica]